MTEAIFGLLGVLIGGLLSGGVSFAMERRRLKTDGKIAARLVGNELEVNDVAINTSLTNGVYDGLKYARATEWEEQRGALAAVLTNEEWATVGNYFTVARHVISMAEARPRGCELEDSVRVDVESLREAGARATKVCQRYAAA